jgi:hypothetical protein
MDAILKLHQKIKDEPLGAHRVQARTATESLRRALPPYTVREPWRSTAEHRGVDYDPTAVGTLPPVGSARTAGDETAPGEPALGQAAAGERSSAR